MEIEHNFNLKKWQTSIETRAAAFRVYIRQWIKFIALRPFRTIELYDMERHNVTYFVSLPTPRHQMEN